MIYNTHYVDQTIYRKCFEASLPSALHQGSHDYKYNLIDTGVSRDMLLIINIMNSLATHLRQPIDNTPQNFIYLESLVRSLITNDSKRLASLVTLNVFVQVDVHEKKNIPFLNVEKITNKLRDCDWICKKQNQVRLTHTFYFYYMDVIHIMCLFRGKWHNLRK